MFWISEDQLPDGVQFGELDPQERGNLFALFRYALVEEQRAWHAGKITARALHDRLAQRVLQWNEVEYDSQWMEIRREHS